MTATTDPTNQTVQVGALVHLDPNVLSHGIGLVCDDYPPLVLTFQRDEQGNVTGYEINPVQPEHPGILTVNFVKVGAVLEKPSKIIGVQKTPKLIIPEA